MPRTIEIHNLKSIKHLLFEIPAAGVHLLSGTNGSGKTTLLACLRRIGHPNSFPLHFRTSQYSDFIDDFTGASITYDVGSESVRYVYAGERWVPRPRRASKLLETFAYPQVHYAGATAERITPRDEDFKPARMKAASPAIRDAANKIFETDRFAHLKTINLTTGNRNQAFVLAPPAANHKQRYISERNFILGELCVLKLLRDLVQCQRGSLVLIDELELALHPRAQLGLFKYLEEVSRDKSLTVVVSTHSVTLLKGTPRAKLMFLEQKEDSTIIIKNCFPAYALGNLSFTEERSPDIILYVEDEAAKSLADSLLRLSISVRYPPGSHVFPTTRVIPVGDFKQVVRFYDRNHSMLPLHVRQHILLDQDVESESLSIMAAASNNSMRDLFYEHSDRIKYLPWTPEVGLIDYISTNRAAVQQQLRAHFSNAFINVSAQMVNLTSTTQPSRRQESKTKSAALTEDICEQIGSGMAVETVRHHLYSMFTEWYFQNKQAEAIQLMGPLIA